MALSPSSSQAHWLKEALVHALAPSEGVVRKQQQQISANMQRYTAECLDSSSVGYINTEQSLSMCLDHTFASAEFVGFTAFLNIVDNTSGAVIRSIPVKSTKFSEYSDRLEFIKHAYSNLHTIFVDNVISHEGSFVDGLKKATGCMYVVLVCT